MMAQSTSSTTAKKGKVLIVEDHSFFAEELIEYLRDDCFYEVVHASNFLDAVRLIKKENGFDFSILDILLQNGKTGVDIAEKFKDQLGRILFVTGCVDEAVLNKIENYASTSKLHEIWSPLEKFLAGGTPKINENETTSRFIKIKKAS